MDGALITTRELAEHGFDAEAIRRLVRADVLSRRHRGVYVIGDPPITFHRAARAALLAVGPAAAVSMRSGLVHWLMRPPREGPVHVSVPGRGGRERRDGIVVHRPLRLPEEDMVEHEGVRVTTPTRTLLDTARTLPRHARLRALEAAERHRLHVERDRLDGCRALRESLRLFDALGACTRSDAEAMFLFLCHDFAIPLPLVNRVHQGREWDFRWPQARLIVEVDGFAHHDGAGRDRFENDRDRGLIAAEIGYGFERFSARQIRREQPRIARVLRQRLRP